VIKVLPDEPSPAAGAGTGEEEKNAPATKKKKKKKKKSNKASSVTESETAALPAQAVSAANAQSLTSVPSSKSSQTKAVSPTSAADIISKEGLENYVPPPGSKLNKDEIVDLLRRLDVTERVEASKTGHKIPQLSKEDLVELAGQILKDDTQKPPATKYSGKVAKRPGDSDSDFEFSDGTDSDDEPPEDEPTRAVSSNPPTEEAGEVHVSDEDID